MLDIIALYFLAGYNGKIAQRKGLKPITWKLNTIFAWIFGELIGVIIGLNLFGLDKILMIMLFALPCAFAGFHIVKSTLERKPDIHQGEIN